MASISRTVATLVVVGIGAVSMATEEAKYKVEEQDGAIEVRNYEAQVVAETVVKTDMEQAGSQAFHKLFRYISGSNKKKKKVEMTAPVSQQAKGQKIDMTSPVGQQRAEEGWVVSFMMPASYTLETLPQPEDTSVRLREIPARRMAAIRYSGLWSKKGYLQHKAQLEAWIEKKGLTIKGAPTWARYNPPVTPWFLRRNEVLIPIESDTDKNVPTGSVQ